jgi:hypothetical protein
MNGCIPIGLASGDDVDLWPAWDQEIGDQSVVVVGQSMNAVRSYMESWKGLSPVVPHNLRVGRAASNIPEHYLFIGQNNWLPGLIRELSAVVPPRSTGTLLVNAHETVERLPFFAGSPVDIEFRSEVNEPLDSDEFISHFNHVIVMADHSVSDEESDSKVLTDVLACRVHLETRDNSIQPMTVVAELRQRASKHIAAVRLADDLLVSEALTACTMAQLALYPENAVVLRHLLGADSPVFLQGISAAEILGDCNEMLWSEVQEILRMTTGEIAMALRGVNDQLGMPVVQMNPKDDGFVVSTDDVVVLTRLHTEESVRY